MLASENVCIEKNKVNSSPKFFERFRQLREELGENQEEYARRFGVSRNYVGMIENGRDPGDTFLKLFDIIEKQWRSNQLANAIQNGHATRGASEEPATVKETPTRAYSAKRTEPELHIPQLSPNAARRLIAVAEAIRLPASDLLNTAVHSYLDTLPEIDPAHRPRKQS